MTRQKNRWFQKLFNQCILSRNNYLSHQVGNEIEDDDVENFFYRLIVLFLFAGIEKTMHRSTSRN
jgi:hypothetical protein